MRREVWRVQLMSIGRFSKMTRLSVKALRLYDEIGLLAPAHVDPSSGYRYYRPAQANQAEVVRILRSVEMPLDDIRTVLGTDDPELVHKHLVAYRELLAERLATQERRLRYLESLIQREEGIMPYGVEIIEEAPQVIAATMVHTNLSTIGDDIGAGFGALMGAMSTEGVMPSGPPLILYPTVIDEETDGDIEVCVPVPDSFTGSGGVYKRELEGGTMASTMHRGPYDQISAAYRAVMGWISEHGHEVTGAPREIYLNDPQQVAPEELLTRVQFPID